MTRQLARIEPPFCPVYPPGAITRPLVDFAARVTIFPV